MLSVFASLVKSVGGFTRKGFPAMFRSFIGGALAASIAGSVAARTVTVESYSKDKDYFRIFDEAWLDGVYNGLEAANIALMASKQTPLFCPPPKMVMTESQVKSILDRFIVDHNDKVNMSNSIDALLLIALEETFPCP